MADTGRETAPLISVIMPAYNARRYIAEAVESVLAQSWENWELVIVDDCSEDATAQVLAPYLTDGRIRYLRSDHNRGASRTRRYAAEQARGEWLAILDSDDAWAPDKLEKQMAVQRESDADLVFTASAFMDENSRRMDWILRVPETISYRQLLKQNRISNSSVLVRRDLYLAHCAVGDQMHEDFACWLSMLKASARVVGLDEPLLIYRVTATSKSGNKLKAARMNWNTYRHVGLSVPAAAYYMVWYFVNGVLKYRNLK